MGWFRTKLPIDADEFEWQLATTQWFQGQDAAMPKRRGGLVTPTVDYFPPSAAVGHAKAKEYLAAVLRQYGMEDWPCRLEPGEDDRPHRIVSGLALVHSSTRPLGTFSWEGAGAKEPVIRYKPSTLANPMQLVATLAHEVAHFRMSYSEDPPPGGWDVEEIATDLLAVYAGFGIFLANSARNFQAFTSFDEQGWSNQSSGYLSEAALVTALAVTERLAGREPVATAAPYLKPHLAEVLKRADKYLRKHHPLLQDSVDAIDLADFAS